MEQNINNKIELKDKIITIYRTNKLKIYGFLCILIIVLISAIFFAIQSEKKNNIVAEKYVKAGLFLAENQIEQSIKLYEEIIFSKNKFYSILALQTILEEDLITEKKRILNYFQTIENQTKTEEQHDLIIFKKALYLIKISNVKDGNDLLEKLISNDSKFKFLAKEVLKKY